MKTGDKSCKEEIPEQPRGFEVAYMIGISTLPQVSQPAMVYHSRVAASLLKIPTCNADTS